MKRKLLIVESPAKIKTITKFLGKDFTIMSTMGHIKDLPTNKLGIKINGAIAIEYTIIEGKAETVAKLAKAAAKADAVYLAPDPDREGEIIAWHAQQELQKTAKKNTPFYRISFNEITKEAVIQSLEHTTQVDEHKVGAQQARRVLDRWVGYEVSPILWKKIGPGLSAGRVQSVALRLVCEREQAIRSFKPEEYWSIIGTFTSSDYTIQATLATVNGRKKEIKNKEEASALVANLSAIKQFTIESIIDKKRLKNPHPPFMTSSLQQAAFNELGLSVQKTMQIAQQLYEGVPLEDPKSPVALITYMRTDSLRIAESALAQVRDFIKKEYTSDYLPSKTVVYEKKSKAKAQDAHEAIRPINVQITPQSVMPYLSKDQTRLYELIWSRFVACQMAPAEYAQRQVIIKGGIFTFSTTGSTLLFDGFLKAYTGLDDEEKGDEKEEKTVLPPELKKSDSLTLKKTDPKQHFTQPPAKYTEATIVKALEKEGIGRPSTYAAILNTIKARNYVTIDKKKFTPTELGFAVTKLLVDSFADIMDVKFTARMEEDLDKIAHGELDRDILLRQFYQTFQKDLAALTGKSAKKVVEPTDIDCPLCKSHQLAIRFGRSGEFLGCLGYPNCTFTSNFKRNEQGVLELVKETEPETLDILCPQCGKALRKVRGKFGPFIACSGYPECNYIHKEKAEFACPLCKGEVVSRKWRGGKFWGCSNYPTCTFAVFGEIENISCPQCKLPFLVKKTTKAGTTISCWSKECGYQQDS